MANFSAFGGPVDFKGNKVDGGVTYNDFTVTAPKLKTDSIDNNPYLDVKTNKTYSVEDLKGLSELDPKLMKYFDKRNQ